MKREIVRSPDGTQPLAVVRPRTPELQARAIALAKEAAEKQDQALFQKIPSMIADYTFMGLLGRDRRSGKFSVVDGAGKWLGDLQAGDSFLGANDVKEMERRRLELS